MTTILKIIFVPPILIMLVFLIITLWEMEKQEEWHKDQHK